MEHEKITRKIEESVTTLVWCVHARREAEDDDISESKLEDALKEHFLVIEHYADDPYGESALVLTYVNGLPVHAVLSPRYGLCYLITVYRPDEALWDSTFRKRVKR